MSEPLDGVEIARQWVEKAEHDLLNIENNLVAFDIPWDTVCFHAQQCAEKYFRALLAWQKVEFPKTQAKRIERPSL
jgi:HEPN domain-containing protein